MLAREGLGLPRHRSQRSIDIKHPGAGANFVAWDAQGEVSDRLISSALGLASGSCGGEASDRQVVD